MKREVQLRLVNALDFALESHGHQKRKGKDVPYVSHLLQVAGFVLEYGGDIELAIAALLHDVVEDCQGVTVEHVRAKFGDRVATIVHNCTDLMEDDTPDKMSEWSVRKEAYIKHLDDADPDTQLVALCDKLHNISNVLADLRHEGIVTFDKFSAGPEKQLWYYESVGKAVSDSVPEALQAEYQLHLAALKEYVVVDS
ncbi:MAG: (p)ppGpp synthase/HD superfamily hydrolase [Planctomycetota bacterium]|jgi:(p)ppGpp synthase/HD superfamily hydrolase